MTALLDAIFRWMHILTGILWIGHLYFFNFVNIPLQGKLDGPTKKAVNPELLPRALYWFRWGAFWTWTTGVVLLLLVFYHGRAVLNDPAAGFGGGTWLMLAVTFLAVFVYDAILKSPLAANLKAAYALLFVLLAVVVALFVYIGGFSQRGTLIHTGTMFGTIMAFNVWYRIWPAQQKIIRAVKEGTAPDADLVKMAGLRSRQNTYMSVPLFFAMIDQHTTYFYGGNLGLTESTYWIGWLVIIGVAWHIVWQLYRKSGKVEGF